jgi:hypothetical protein
MKLKEFLQALADGKTVTDGNNAYLVNDDGLKMIKGEHTSISKIITNRRCFSLYTEPELTLKERVMKYKGKWIRSKRNSTEEFVLTVRPSNGVIETNGMTKHVGDIEEYWEIVE